jgi:hypothetical protein
MAAVKLPDDVKLDAPSAGSAQRLPDNVPLDQPPSFAQGFGAGLMDKIYGLGQIGAHATLDPPPIAYTAEQEKANQVQPEAAKAVDVQLQQREKQLEKEGYNKGWGRTVGGIAGDVALTAPLSIIAPEMGGASLMGRVGSGIVQGAMGGAISGAATPETSGDFAKGKAGQLVRGGLEGGAGGGAFGALSHALSLGTPEAAENFIKHVYTQYIKPGVAGKGTVTKANDAYAGFRGALDHILDRKGSLELTDPTRPDKIVGQAPQSLAQFAESIDQTKRKIFEEYNAKATAASAATNVGAPVPQAFQRDLAQAQSKAMDASLAVRDAEMRLSGMNSIEGQAAARKELNAARANLDRMSAIEQEALKKTKGLWVDLNPIVKELRKLGKSTLAESDSDVVRAANQLADNYAAKVAYTPLEAQEAIKNFNGKLQAFYRQATPNYASRSAAIDAMVANKMREALDTTIEKATGPGYQALKNAYGQVRSIEKDVVHRSIVQGRNVKGGLGSTLLDIASGDQLIHALVHFDPSALASAAGFQIFRSMREHMFSPNRAVKQMFEAAEKLRQTQPSAFDRSREAVSSGIQRTIPAIGAAVGYQSPQHSALGIQ